MYWKLISIDEESADVFFPHLVEINVDLSGMFTNQSADNLFRANPQLQKLHIAHNSLTLTELLDLISGNPSVYKMEIIANYTDVHMIELDRFVAEHPMIVELKFGSYRFTADDAINFIRQLDSLKHFEFSFKDEDESEFDRLLNRLSNEWQHDKSYYSDRSIKLTR